MLPLEPLAVLDVEESYKAWVERCMVSHAGQFAALRNATVAFHRPTKPLSNLRVALGTSGGVHIHTDAGFDMISHSGDSSVRWIAGDAATSTLHFSHDHYDHTDPDQDPNCIFPLDRLRDLAANGLIGSVAPRHLGFMGWIPNPDRFVRETALQVIEQLKQDQVDAIVLTPG